MGFLSSSVVVVGVVFFACPSLCGAVIHWSFVRSMGGHGRAGGDKHKWGSDWCTRRSFMERTEDREEERKKELQHFYFISVLV